jgi:hypothetical protein
MVKGDPRIPVIFYFDNEAVDEGGVKLKLEHTAPYMALNKLEGRQPFERAPPATVRNFFGFKLKGQYHDFRVPEIIKMIEFIAKTKDVHNQVTT